MRNQCIGFDTDFHLKRQIQAALEESTLNQSIDMSFEYKPSTVEKYFAPTDATTKKIQNLVIQKT
jgi:hypothetical protein